MKNSIIIDGNNLMYRALKVFHLSYKGKSTSMIYGVPNIIRGLITSLNASRVYVVFDGGRSIKRKEIFPTYKDRDKGDDFDFEDFKRQKEEIIKALVLLGIPVIVKKGWEADDIIWLLTRRLKRKSNVIIVSTDKDFNQLISKKVSIWSPFKNKRITYKNVMSISGYEAYETVDYLILDGDKSDCIPGVPGMGKVTIRKFLDENKSIRNYLISNLPQFKKFDKKSIEEVYLLNRQLIDIRLFIRNEKASIKSLEISLKPKIKKIKTQKLNQFIAEYDLRSFQKESFIKVFKRLNYEDIN